MRYRTKLLRLAKPCCFNIPWHYWRLVEYSNNQCMKPVATTGERLHALDNLRALMMWLGIVLHVSAIHMVHDSPLPWADERTTELADFLSAAIHAFRMPVFFILAGFFVALLIEKRGLKGMLNHRLRRLGLPFVIFWLPLFAATVICALLFMHRMAHGTWGLDPALALRDPRTPKGLNTVHLWFLWMLLWFCVFTVPTLWLAQRVPSIVLSGISTAFQKLGSSAWGFLVLAIPLAWIGSYYPIGVVQPNGAFIPPITEWLHNGLFYLFGYYFYRHQQTLFALYTRRWGRLAFAGLVFFFVTGALVEARRRTGDMHLIIWISWVYNCTSWLWSFAFIGFFVRHLHQPRRWLSYLAESSYWVYLVHMPLTIAFGALLYGLPFPAELKMLVNIGATTLVCIITYHLVVRFTVLGVLLNGRRHTRHSVVRHPQST